MKYGIYLFATDYCADIAILAQRAEALGFDALWVPEHPIVPVQYASRLWVFPDGVLPDWFAGAYDKLVDPLVALARASAVTKTLKLGTGICLVPECNPLRLAKEIATLDHYSGGRFLFGIGTGWIKEETTIMGGDAAHPWGQTREAIRAMKELWTKDEAEFHGQYYDFPLVRSFPKPVQQPHPPIFFGDLTGSAVFRRIVAWGNGWLPFGASPEQVKSGREALNHLATEAGRDPRSIQIMVLGVPADPEVLKAYEQAGADAVACLMLSAPEKEALAQLEQIAQTVLP